MVGSGAWSRRSELQRDGGGCEEGGRWSEGTAEGEEGRTELRDMMTGMLGMSLDGRHDGSCGC